MQFIDPLAPATLLGAMTQDALIDSFIYGVLS